MAIIDSFFLINSVYESIESWKFQFYSNKTIEIISDKQVSKI
jgi:hypothetical protein